MGTAQEPRQGRRLTVAELLRIGTAGYVAAHPGQAVPHVQSTLAKSSLCRTSALGGRKYRCDGCAEDRIVYNSCGDRHCPTCSGAKRRDWMDSTSQLILDGVTHYQVVFTLPDRLSRLALGNRKQIYDLLFQSAWKALQQTIQSEQGYDPAAAMVLHTWNQKLEPHAHVHAIVPGAGPSLDTDDWKESQRPGADHADGNYLVSVDDLCAAYREAFLHGLASLQKSGDLKLEGEFEYLQTPAGWKAFEAELASVSWNCFIEPPPNKQSDPADMIKYLARYLTGGPISDARIVSADDRNVTFLAREGTTPGGDCKQVPITLTITEFVRRWSLHIVPKAYTKTRRYGGWSNPRRESYIDDCLRLLEIAGVPYSDTATDFGPFDEEGSEQDSEAKCPSCGCEMILHSVTDKPSWSVIMNSTARPAWYQRHGQS